MPMRWPALCPRPGIFVRLVEFGINPAFAVLFLRSQNLPHQGRLACLVPCAVIVAWFLAGAARHLFWLTHGRILLSSSAVRYPARSTVLRNRHGSMPRDIAIHRAAPRTAGGR